MGSLQTTIIKFDRSKILNRGSDMISFLTAVKDNMKGPFEKVLDKMEVNKVTLIVADVMMMWLFEVANKRNIPVAAYFAMSGEMFSVMHHVDLLESNSQLYADVSERGKESIDYIPGISSLTIADIPMFLHDGTGQMLKNLVPDLSSVINKANYVLISTIYELEPKVIDALRVRLKIPVYTSGPNIPYSQNKPSPSLQEPDYLTWLDSKPPRTVLYVSLGSFLSVSSDEMYEIAAGLTQSGANFLWVARGKASHFKEMCGEKGMVVGWCNQLRVLLHSSIGGFWTHCGWNSVKESLFSGIPMLTLLGLMLMLVSFTTHEAYSKNTQDVIFCTYREARGTCWKYKFIESWVHLFIDIKIDLALQTANFLLYFWDEIMGLLVAIYISS